MTKVKIDKKMFDMSEDASLVLEAFLDKQRMYLEKGKITKQEFDITQKTVEDVLMSILDKQSNIEKSDIETIIDSPKFKKVLSTEKNVGILGLIGQLIINFFKIILSIFVVLFKLIIVVVKIIILAILALIILAFIFSVPLVFFPWVIDSQIIFSFIPDIVKYSLVITEISFVLFFTYILLSLSNSKFSKNGILTVAIISLIIGLNGVVYGGYNMLYNYGHSFDKIEKYSFVTTDAKVINLEGIDKLNLDLPDFWINDNCPTCNNVDGNFFRIIESTGSNIELEVRTIIKDKNKAESDKYFTKLNNLDFALEGDKLILKTPKDKIFKEVVPYQFIRREITIIKPEGIEITGIFGNAQTRIK